MTARTTPPFRADHVGSFLRPKYLLEARAQKQAGAISAAQLREVEDRAIDTGREPEIVGAENDRTCRISLLPGGFMHSQRCIS